MIILVRDIGHYHSARYAAYAARAPDAVHVIASLSFSEYDEFSASRIDDRYSVTTLFETREEFESAYRSGRLKERLWGILDGMPCNDIVAVPGWAFPESLSAILWAKQRGRRIVIMSESQRNDGPRNALRELAKSRVISVCDAALVGGSTHADYMASLGTPRQRIFAGYDAVDNEHFSRGADLARANAVALREEYGLPRSFLLASARFIFKKNLPALIAAYVAATRGRTAPPHLVILGNGRERTAVVEAIASHAVGDRVHLPGFRKYDELPIYYGLADGFVHVSITEQWGLVINEAMASGVPVIVARNCGAASDLVEDGVNGFLIDAHSVQNIASAIAALIDMPQDARNRMGAASRRIIANWSPDRFASALMSAAEAARSVPARRLAPWDRILLHALSRQSIARVE